MPVIDAVNSMIEELKTENIINTKEVSDTHHTFGDIYFQRMILFSVLCQSYPELSWRTKKHFNNDNDPMYNGDFMAGINTPAGVVSYHMKLEYWDYFEGVPEIEYGPEYDGCTSKENATRALSLVKTK